MMKNHKDYLQREADYQDLKIDQNPRADLNRFYNDEASKYRAKCREEAIGDLNGKKVLDLGCGDGFASMDALRAGASVTAIDISPKSIEYLISMAEKENLNHHLDARVMDAHQLEFEDGTFDIVMGNGILHHLPDLERAMTEIKRVLKESGYAVFLEPLGMNPFINVFRKSTPDCRTIDEKPFLMGELSLIREVFPRVQFTYFECTTLFAKFLNLLRLSGLAKALQKFFIKVDRKILRVKNNTKVTFFQKMSWIVLIKMIK